MLFMGVQHSECPKFGKIRGERVRIQHCALFLDFFVIPHTSLFLEKALIYLEWKESGRINSNYYDYSFLTRLLERCTLIRLMDTSRDKCSKQNT